MSDDLSLFDERMRRPAIISLVGGMTLGFIAVFAQRTLIGTDTPVAMGVVFGLLAAGALYGKSYSTYSKRLD